MHPDDTGGSIVDATLISAPLIIIPFAEGTCFVNGVYPSLNEAHYTVSYPF